MYLARVAFGVAAAFVAATAPVGADAPRGDRLASALLRDPAVAACAHDSGKDAATYARGAFDRRPVALPGGRRAIVAVANDSCLALNQSTRIMIFVPAGAGYRRVLNEVVVPGLESVSSDGTVVLPTHETVAIMFEATYMWNGTTFVFAPLRSHEYDVSVSERRPYEEAVHFAPGAHAIVLRGTVADGFGHTYVFSARAGQRATLAITHQGRPLPSAELYYGHATLPVAALRGAGVWHGTFARGGEYRLIVLGIGEPGESRLAPYTLRLEIR
jgi:hypothetical protein